MLELLLVDNGVAGLQDAFPDRPEADPPRRYRRSRVGPGWQPELGVPKRGGVDALIAPNGTDHVALWRARQRIADYVAAGGAVLCFCGAFTPWLPGMHWVHDNARPTRDMRLHLVRDPLRILEGVDIAGLERNAAGITGWWQCGWLRLQAPEAAVLEDSWGRPVLAAQVHDGGGLVVATASGPLADGGDGGDHPLTRLYLNLMRVVARPGEFRDV